MTRAFDIVTFNCYGTLVDWETGIWEAFAKRGMEDGYDPDRALVLQLHAEIEPAVQAGPYRPYREILIETALQMADRLGWRPLTRKGARFFPESLASWRPFPDVNPALERLAAAGYRLGILSNVDDDLLQATLRQFTVEFDLLVTAEQVRSYKPAHGHFLEARRRLEGARWLHAAQSYVHDVEPAVALGIPVAWVNRKGERAGVAQPTVEVSDLAGLADWLEHRGG
jgi:2-haloacid dehalogenase/putative hydrolase of the HAD superfamily